MLPGSKRESLEEPVFSASKMVRFLFDMDGTVTARETLPMIAERYGILDQVEDLTRGAVQGDVPFVESFEKRVAVLGRLPVDEVSRLVAQAPLHSHVVNFIAGHREQCAIVTSNLDCWCDDLIAKLNCRTHCSSACVTDNRVIAISHVLCKQDVVAAYQAAGDKVVFLGDGHNDREAMSRADVAIAVGLLPSTPAASLIGVAHHVFHDEAALCRLLEAIAHQ